MKKRVLIVDDSSVVRLWLAELFAAHHGSSDSGFEVCGFAADGAHAIERFERLQPDLVTLDLEMPKLDGIEVLRQIRSRDSRKPVLVVSSQTHRGATRTVEALAAGASDYIDKPSARHDGLSREAFATQLLMKSRALVIRQPVSMERKRSSIVSLRTPRPLFAAVLIGSSTGGPEALARVLPHLSGLPVPVLIAQHMPALFTPLLAARLAQLCSAGVQEGVHGMTVRGGDIVIAPGDRHLRIAHESEGGLRLEISSDPPVNFCRPSVDVLFESAATTLADRTLAVILTGMGSDGTSGALRLKSAGATIYVQDEQSSVVWGMPGAATRAGVPDRILSLSAIGAAVARTVMHGRALSPVPLPASPGVSHVPHPRT